MKKHPRTLFPFYVLVAYISLQFVWWTYLLYSLSSEVTSQKELTISLQNSDPLDLENALKELQAKKNRRLIMIGTEGAVFLSLLVFGIYRVKRSFEKETETIQQQKNFMLSVTHELKTPLAAVKLNIQTLLKRELNKDQQKNILENAIADADRLNAMIENVLVASRMENAEVKFFPERVNLGLFIEGFFKNHTYVSRLIFNLNNEVAINADKNLALPSLLSNLIENALKYSEGMVKIELSIENNYSVLSIADQGAGIPTEERKKIFDKFYRIGNEETRKTKGTGLGLFIVKYIVDKCNWKLTIEENTPRGTIFKIYFPQL